jgi:hypothetical protein
MRLTRVWILALVLLLFVGNNVLWSNAKEGMIRCANLIYGGSRTSKCFSDEFLRRIERVSTIRTARRFASVKLSSDEIFKFPFVVMTGEGRFSLPQRERDHLRSYLTRGGFLLASAGCSSKEWDRSFRREMALIFKDLPSAEGLALKRIPMDHPVFHTIKDISALTLSHGGKGYLEGVEWNGKMVVIYSREGLNDTANTTGCCCCGGNEVNQAAEVNMNILSYVLLN